MQTTQYLYGKDSSELPSLVEGFTARFYAAKQQLDTILAVPLLTRDAQHQRDVEKAINFCRSFMEGHS